MTDSTITKDAVSTKRPRHVRTKLLLLGMIVGCLAVITIWIRTDSPASSYRRGRQALLNGDRDIVLKESEHLIRSGQEPHGLLLKGLLLTRAGRFVDAVENLQKAAVDESLAVEANTATARCYYQAGQYLHAIDASMIALDQDPTCLDARRWLAAAYYDLGAVSEATTELERISSEAPLDPRPDRLIGLIAKDSEQFPKAIVYYEKSLKRDPHQDGVEILRHELAECQIKIGKFDEALTMLKNCPRSASALTLEANCESSLGRPDEAQVRLHGALKLDPHYVPAKLALASLHLDQGQVGDAERILEEAALTEPYNRQVHFQLSQAHRANGKTDEADAELSQMLQIQDIEREFSDLHDQAAREPDDAGIRFRIGELAIRLGKPKLATIWFRAALAIQPGHVRAKEELRRIRNLSE